MLWTLVALDELILIRPSYGRTVQKMHILFDYVASNEYVDAFDALGYSMVTHGVSKQLSKASPIVCTSLMAVASRSMRKSPVTSWVARKIQVSEAQMFTK